jgi:hypothetical protein
LQRAEEILQGLEAGEVNEAGKPARIQPEGGRAKGVRKRDQLDLFA